MSSTHVFTVKDVCARLHVNVSSALEAPVSPSSNEESGSKTGTGVVPLASSPTAPDPTHDARRLQVSFSEACNNQKVVTQSNSNWQCPGSPTIPSPFPLDLVYELWHTYVSDEESGIVLSLESSVDGDIFGVGKRPVQREIEKDGCIQLVFVKE